MFLQTVRNELLHACSPKHRVILLNSLLTITRSQSKASSVKLPDSVQLLKPAPTSSSAAALRIKTISKAMKAYLERAKEYEGFLAVKNEEFEIGRQHLANIMGLDAATMTQDDVNRAIEYLLPSGLYEPKARPMMKPPMELYPKEKAAQFDNSGRPFNPFFYTRTANYYAALHTLVAKFYELDAFEDKMIAKGILQPPEESLLNLSGGEWINQDEMCEKFLEKIREQDYMFFIDTLNRLGAHPYSFRCKDELWKYRKEFSDLGALEEIPKLKVDESGRSYIDATGYRKNCVAKVIVRGEGSGKITINGSDILFFNRLQDRETVMYPLVFTGLLGKVDIEADISGIGEKARACALRHGIALCLRSFVDPGTVDKMRLGGMLLRDRRRRGRKMFGQKGCRAKFTWKKR